MSYALRNTLILLSTLVIMISGGWAYLSNVPEKEMDTYQQLITTRERDLANLKAKAEAFDLIREAYIRTLYRRENYNKELFSSNNVANMYDFVGRLNNGPAFTVMNFSLVDSTVTPDHGYVTIQVDGEAPYRNFYAFINRLEQSRPIIRISRLQMQPKTEADKLQDIVFVFTAQIYYARGSTQTTTQRTMLAGVPVLRHNPMAPLIHAIPGNSDNLTNVEASRLVAVTASSIFLVDQTGRMVRIDQGGRVYLGFLERISQNAATATFRLNKGGIEDIVTLRIGQPTNTTLP